MDGVVHRAVAVEVPGRGNPSEDVGPSIPTHVMGHTEHIGYRSVNLARRPIELKSGVEHPVFQLDAVTSQDRRAEKLATTSSSVGVVIARPQQQRRADGRGAR